MHTAATLECLALSSQHIRDAICAAGALPLLVDRLRSGQSQVQGLAARVLKSLASGSQQNKDAIHAAGALPLLVNLVWSGGLSLQRDAVEALTHLGSGTQQNKDAVIAAGTLFALVMLDHFVQDEGMVTAPTKLLEVCLQVFASPIAT